MKQGAETLLRFGLLAFVWLAWWWALEASLSAAANMGIIVGAVLLVFPVAAVGRWLLEGKPSASRVIRVTMFVHVGVGLLFGLAVIRAVLTHRDWSGPVLPIPTGIGLVLVLITGAIGLFTIFNLAMKGWGAPFYIALSRRLAMDWMYGWTRNPMVLSALALLLSVGIWFQSAWFVLWGLAVFTPALLFFVKVFEERELEIRFGDSYREYKSRTPMLFPRRPRG